MSTKLFQLFCASSEFPDTAVRPSEMFFTKAHDTKTELLDELEYFPPFGSDGKGGYAYFGVTSDLEKHWDKVKEYVVSVSEHESHDLPFAARWSLPSNEVLIILYEDYYRRMATPLSDNVLSLKFGAWVGDHQLKDILDEKDTEEWFVGDVPFKPRALKHKALYQHAKRVMAQIVIDQDD